MDPLRSVAPYLAYSLLSFAGWTSRVRWLGLEHVERLKASGSAWIYAFWHQRQAFLTYTHRGSHANVLVSRSRDGEIIARVMELSRIEAVRGSSSRGAAVATRELVELGKAGKVLGITPDGPRGPARQVKPGALFLAQETGLPLLPLTVALSRRLQIERAWDHFQVPLPFARACVIYGAPIYVRPGDNEDAKTQELKAALDRITEEADRLVS
ncbi:MAG: lysophospholipid acyltransferase family protein [Elusimicrobia bacterium]|nr:lysophospholipid acyltransferase family protein [Elusimicrobiota bacterium]